jgi:hypothetical protein
MFVNFRLMLPRLHTPMRLLRIPEPFDHPAFVFEPKIDLTNRKECVSRLRCASPAIVDAGALRDAAAKIDRAAGTLSGTLNANQENGTAAESA